MSVVVDMLKTLRAVPAVNTALTLPLRAVTRGVGIHSDLLVKYMRRIGRVSAELPNGRRLLFFTLADDLIPNQIFWRGWDGYESETVVPFYQLAAKSRVTLDVGAHVGLFALLAGHANVDGQVYAFEPLGTIQQRLVNNIALNGLQNVRCISAAVGDEAGQQEFYYSSETDYPDNSSLSRQSLITAGRLADLATLETVRVNVCTLDGFAAENALDTVDLIKIDTEGTEPAVLAGAERLLGTHHPNIICEVLRAYGTAAAIEEILGDHGYQFYLLTAQGPVQKHRIVAQPDEQWHLRNYLFSTLSPSACEAAVHRRHG